MNIGIRPICLVFNCPTFWGQYINKERVMMKWIIIVVLLVISFPAY